MARLLPSICQTRWRARYFAPIQDRAGGCDVGTVLLTTGETRLLSPVMLKLKRLRVEKFRSVAREAELSFSDGINVLLGQNGTGKTTLLELISMVVRSDFSTLAKEEFAFEYELSAPDEESIVVVVVRNERVAMEQLQRPVELGARYGFRPSAEVFVGADRHRLLRYDADHGLSIGDAPPIGPLGIPAPVDRGFLFFFISNVHNLVLPLTRHLVRAGSVHRLDESLDLFRRITSTADLGNILIAERNWIPNLFAPPLVPYDLIRSIMDSHEPRRPDYSFTHNDLEFLATLKNMMGFSASELRVDVTERQQPTADVQFNNFMFRFKWEDGTVITHDHLSYGQKRLVCFLYYLACNPDIVITDELVNGLHHRWITASIEAIGQRQAFLTSQNPLLLDYIPITSAAEARRSFVLCRGEPRVGRPGWVWENMSEEDAQELFSAYGVGVEHVSEILQSRGLW